MSDLAKITREQVMDSVFVSRPHDENDWNNYMNGSDEEFVVCDALGLDPHDVICNNLIEKYDLCISVYQKLPPRIESDTFIGAYFPIDKKHPLHDQYLQDNEEYIVSIEEWDNILVSKEEEEKILALGKKGVSDIIITRCY